MRWKHCVCALDYTMCYSITSECVSILLGHRSTCAPEFLIQLLCVCVCAEVPCFVHHGSIQKCWISALFCPEQGIAVQSCLERIKGPLGYMFYSCMYGLFKNKQLVYIALFLEQSLLPLKPSLSWFIRYTAGWISNSLEFSLYSK